VLHELTENGATFKVLAGRYGPYVTDGTTNASLPKAMSPDAVTFAQAAELLAARRDAPPSPRRTAAKRKTTKGAKARPRRKAAGA
jgi:DNA topoisomerase-1